MVKGIADKIGAAMKKAKLLPLGIEGQDESRWILMDYNVIVVHIFLEDERASYQLEELYQAVDERNRE